MSIIDWLADKVQTSTGEKERRELVQTVKELAEEFRQRVSDAIARLNERLDGFNKILVKLNEYRSKYIKTNIEQLYIFYQSMDSASHTTNIHRKRKNCRLNFQCEKWFGLKNMFRRLTGPKMTSFSTHFY